MTARVTDGQVLAESPDYYRGFRAGLRAVLALIDKKLSRLGDDEIAEQLKELGVKESDGG